MRNERDGAKFILGSMLRILVVDDRKAWREDICRVIATHPELQVVAQAASSVDAVCLAEELQPDFVVLDFELSLNGLTTAVPIFEISPASRVIFLSPENDPVTVLTGLGAGSAVGCARLNERRRLSSPQSVC
jgi:two-component system response regulator DesR